MKHLISVVVPTYNVAPYIDDFFKSILSQSYKNLEIIIVTDAPTDDSLKIAKSYAKKDKRIRIIENSENMGVAKTLARGYAAATGDFCATMSPDDTIDMFYFENLINKYEQTKSDVICARMFATKNNYMFSDGTEFTLYPFAGKISALFYFYPAMVRRKLIVENNIWNETMVERHWEDIIVRCKYAYYANHVSIATKAIRFYTIRQDSLSHKPTEQQIEYQKRAEQRSADFLHSVGIDDVRIKIVNGFRIDGGWDIKSFFIDKEMIQFSQPKKNKHHSFWCHLKRMKF
ncbi:MAG: glycosyltransferase family 2 protein [Alphaproteobacteria bacterium]|nr:glycosyltransferase family 2 protein [Alphaproteobacteria bacterium]